MLLFLIPPSEGKAPGGRAGEGVTRSYGFPYQIAVQATPRDLKCKGERYEEGITLNQAAQQSTQLLPAIDRYTGVMYKAISYAELSPAGQDYLDQHLLILSGLWGRLAPHDEIPNYKLPIDTKGLKQFRQPILTERLLDQTARSDQPTLISLLPQTHTAMLDWQQLTDAGIPSYRIDFCQQLDDGTTKKLTHGVKKVRGAFLHYVASQQIETFTDLTGVVSSFSSSYQPVDLTAKLHPMQP